jgi:hypothetical protein
MISKVQFEKEYFYWTNGLQKMFAKYFGKKGIEKLRIKIEMMKNDIYD